MARSGDHEEADQSYRQKQTNEGVGIEKQRTSDIFVIFNYLPACNAQSIGCWSQLAGDERYLRLLVCCGSEQFWQSGAQGQVITA